MGIIEYYSMLGLWSIFPRREKKEDFNTLCLSVKKIILKRNNEFLLYHLHGNALISTRTPAPGHETYNGHHYYILSLSDLCLGVKKKILKEIMHLHYMTYLVNYLTKDSCAGGHETYNSFWPFLGHHYYILIYKSSKASYKRHIQNFQAFSATVPRY